VCFSKFKELTDFLLDFRRPVTFDCFGRGKKTPTGGDGDANRTFDLKNLFTEISKDDFITPSD
jgi:hypothetical protein